jgi:hypothetical protein
MPIKRDGEPDLVSQSGGDMERGLEWAYHRDVDSQATCLYAGFETVSLHNRVVTGCTSLHGFANESGSLEGVIKTIEDITRSHHTLGLGPGKVRRVMHVNVCIWAGITPKQ